MNEPLNAKRFGKVAVLMGGHSAEREVSLNSGNAVLGALLSKNIDAHAVDVGLDVIQVLSAGGFERAFIALHGRGGEDGTIQGALEILGMPHTGSGVLGSALGMDKLRTKQVWAAQDLPTPGYQVIATEQELNKAATDLGFPMMIKPSHEGSSIGIAKVNTDEELLAAWQDAASYDCDVIAESWVTGKEYTAAILGEQSLPLIRLETPNEIYDYDAKYLLDTTQYHCPCGLDELAEKEFQALAKRAFKAVGASGWGRVDFMCDEKGLPWLIEVNTVPGLTDHSLVPMAAEQAGYSFADLILQILAETLND